jgi:ABC-2 type transport system permease protein/lipopolysaccharide transport system permease protein
VDGVTDRIAELPREALFRRHLRPASMMADLWASREAIRSLAERDWRVRYKQAVLGLAWAVLTPVMLMLVFTLVFEHGARVTTEGQPYPLFAYLGLLPWAFFSTSISQGVMAIVGNNALLNKVYFPREVFGIAKVVVALFDMAISALVLILLFGINTFMPKPTSYWVIPLLLIMLAFSLGLAIFLSGVSVYLRDIRQAVPILLQLGLFITPVAYDLSYIPASLRGGYVALNPLGAVIDGMRRSVLLGKPPHAGLTLIAAVSSLIYLVAGYSAFKRMEKGLADVA